MTPSHPELFLISEDEAPKLLVGRCGNCGDASFPPETYGCDRCGADPSELTVDEIEPVGTLRAFATVHRHPSRPTPFTLMTIELDEGVTCRVMRDRPGDEGLAVGDRARGVLIDGREPGEVELRFESGGAG